MLGFIAEWIIKHRKGNAFKDYTFNKILAQLRYCSDHYSMLCVVDSFDNILGVVCCTINKEDKVCFVDDILTIHKDALRSMLQFFHENFPGYKLEGLRNQEHKRFTKLEK